MSSIRRTDHNTPLLDANVIAAELLRMGQAWADADGAANALEETRQAVYSQIAAEFMREGDSAAKAELKAKADPRYMQHLEAMVRARTAANRQRVAYDVAKVKAELLRSNASTERALATLR